MNIQSERVSFFALSLSLSPVWRDGVRCSCVISSSAHNFQKKYIGSHHWWGEAPPTQASLPTSPTTPPTSNAGPLCFFCNNPLRACSVSSSCGTPCTSWHYICICLSSSYRYAYTRTIFTYSHKRMYMYATKQLTITHTCTHRYRRSIKTNTDLCTQNQSAHNRNIAVQCMTFAFCFINPGRRQRNLQNLSHHYLLEIL